MIFSKTVVALLLIAMYSVALPQQRDEDEVVFIGATDPEIVSAIKHARRTLPEFLILAADPPVGTSGYKIKVMITDGAKAEHFWVSPFNILATGFSGVIANEPKVVKNVKVGELVHFDESHISDWGYIKAGRQVGSFTVCALFKVMPVEQADYYRRNHGFDC